MAARSLSNTPPRANVVSVLRAGVVGPGSIGRLHVETLRWLGIPVMALVASTPESAKAHADRLQIPRAYDSAAAMAGSGEVDVVHICTPNAMHAADAAAAVDAGCDLVCEKPLTLEVAQADDLLRRASRAGVSGAVCYHYRCFAGIVAARELVRGGALGEVRMLVGSYLSQELRQMSSGHWLANPAIVGSALSLADVGIHWLDLAEHVSGLPIRAVIAQPAGEGRHEPFARGAAVLLRLGADAVGSLVVSQDCPGVVSDELVLEVHGSAGSLRWTLGAGGEELRVAGEQDRPVPRSPACAESFQAGTARAFRVLFQDVYQRLREGGDEARSERLQNQAAARPCAVPTLIDGRRGVAILAAAVSSASLGTWVEVAPASS